MTQTEDAAERASILQILHFKQNTADCEGRDMEFYHYYDRSTGPFRSLTALPDEEAGRMLDTIRKEHPGSMCAARDDTYIDKRRRCESLIRREFAAKGGRPELDVPYYMTAGHSPWLASWYEDSGSIRIPADEFDPMTVSFTYGDSMPTFSPRVNDGKEYRRKVYTFDEIHEIIEKYGFPQEWNADGKYGPERYIEVHVWSSEIVQKYFSSEYAVTMVYDRKDVPGSRIECIPFDARFSEEYRAAYNEAFRPMREALDIKPYNWYKDSDDLSGKAGDTFLLADDNGLIGAVSCIGTEIDDLFVCRGRQGKGLGRALLCWGMEHIRAHSDAPITLHSAEWNTRAVKLYRETGFAVSERTLIKTVARQ